MHCAESLQPVHNQLRDEVDVCNSQLFTYQSPESYFSQQRQTFVRCEGAFIFYIQVRKGAMYMRADFLASFRGTENPNDRNFWLLVELRWLDISFQLRIKLSRSSLIMIDAIETYSKEVHGKSNVSGWRHPTIIEIVNFHDVAFFTATLNIKEDSMTSNSHVQQVLV